MRRFASGREMSDGFSWVLRQRGVALGGFGGERRRKWTCDRPSCRQAHHGDQEKFQGEGRLHMRGRRCRNEDLVKEVHLKIASAYDVVPVSFWSSTINIILSLRNLRASKRMKQMPLFPCSFQQRELILLKALNETQNKEVPQNA
jgi:hypothetical protein